MEVTAAERAARKVAMVEARLVETATELLAPEAGAMAVAGWVEKMSSARILGSASLAERTVLRAAMALVWQVVMEAERPAPEVGVKAEVVMAKVLLDLAGVKARAVAWMER